VHVQRGIHRGGTIAGIALLPVPHDGQRSTRSQVEPTDALIVQIAKVQCIVGSENETVWVVDLVIRVSGGTRPYECRDGGTLRHRRYVGDETEKRLERVTSPDHCLRSRQTEHLCSNQVALAIVQPLSVAHSVASRVDARPRAHDSRGLSPEA
jgi:hypothetical protein